MGMILKYVEISVAAKMSVKFRGVSKKYGKLGKNSRKMPFFTFSIFLPIEASALLVEFCWKYYAS